MALLERICLMCQKPYVGKYGGKGRGTIYCSMSCRMRHRNLINNL